MAVSRESLHEALARFWERYVLPLLDYLQGLCVQTKLDNGRIGTIRLR